MVIRDGETLINRCGECKHSICRTVEIHFGYCAGLNRLLERDHRASLRDFREWLQIESELVLDIGGPSLYLPLHVLFTFIIELDSSAHHRRRPLFKGWSQVHIPGYDALVQQVDHAFINVVLRNGRGVIRRFQHGSRGLWVPLEEPPLFVLVEIRIGALGCIAGSHRALLQDPSPLLLRLCALQHSVLVLLLGTLIIQMPLAATRMNVG